MTDERLGELFRARFDDLKEDLTEIKAELKGLVPMTFLVEALKSRDERISRLEQDNQQKSGLVKAAIYGSAGSFIVGILIAVVTVAFRT